MGFLVGNLTSAISALRYLQRLVSVQASRNRDLEQEIHACQQNSGTKHPNGAGMSGKELTIFWHRPGVFTVDNDTPSDELLDGPVKHIID